MVERDSLFIREGFREGRHSCFSLMGGWRMTGSAYQAMDVLFRCDSLYRVGVWGRDYAKFFLESRLADDGKRFQAMDVIV